MLLATCNRRHLAVYEINLSNGVVAAVGHEDTDHATRDVAQLQRQVSGIVEERRGERTIDEAGRAKTAVWVRSEAG